MRTATLGSPAVTKSGNGSRFRQHERQRARPEALGERSRRVGETRATTRASIARSSTWTMSGSKRGRRLISKIRATADAIEGERPQAVDGFGRKSDDAALAQHLDRARDALRSAGKIGTGHLRAPRSRTPARQRLQRKGWRPRPDDSFNTMRGLGRVRTVCRSPRFFARRSLPVAAGRLRRRRRSARRGGVRCCRRLRRSRGSTSRTSSIIVQENRTFDNLFATYPGADGTTVGKTHNGKLRPCARPISRARSRRTTAIRTGCEPATTASMNGFDTIPIGKVPGTYVYQYVNPAQIRPYWDLAAQYVLADHIFQTQGSGSFTAHQDLIRGGTEISGSQSLIDFPNGRPWGCDAPSGTVTVADHHGEPVPALSGTVSVPDVRDAARLARCRRNLVALLRAGRRRKLRRRSVERVRRDRGRPPRIRNGRRIRSRPKRRSSPTSIATRCPPYRGSSRIIANSDHPGDSSDTGPSWVAQVVNAIGKSPAWNTTAILVVWDDWGGWYDHVPPPGARRSGGLGFRVPHARGFSVRQKRVRFASSVRARQHRALRRGQLETWGVSERPTERRPISSSDFFDFTQAPRKFVPIQTPSIRNRISVHEAPSNKPVDDE